MINTKYFVCLANSFKNDGRCIAGIEIEKKETGNWSIVHNNNTPKWIRPICEQGDHGAIPNNIAIDIQPFDIVEIINAIPIPEKAQQENYKYDSIRKIGHINDTIQNITEFITTSHQNLFGNKGKAVHPDQYNELTYSLMFIQPENVSFKLGPRYDSDYERLKIEFDYNNTHYNLPDTDPEFIRKNLQEANAFTTYFITLSLAVEYNGWHSKLVAFVKGF